MHITYFFVIWTVMENVAWYAYIYIIDIPGEGIKELSTQAPFHETFLLKL